MRHGDVWTGVLFGAEEDQLGETWGGLRLLLWGTLSVPAGEAFPGFTDSRTSQIFEVYPGRNELWAPYIGHQDKTSFFISRLRLPILFKVLGSFCFVFVGFCSGFAVPGGGTQGLGHAKCSLPLSPVSLPTLCSFILVIFIRDFEL